MGQYANQSVVFLEFDVDDSIFSARKSRFWTAFSGGGATLPLVMVDSGNEISSGYEDFVTVYSGMVDSSLLRPAKAEIAASSQRNGDTIQFDVQLTNQSGVTLGSGNNGTVWAIVYEKFETAGTGRVTNRLVRAAVSTSISTDLAHGETDSFTVDTPALSGVNWDNLQWIVLADYRPGGHTGVYDTLQAISSLNQQVFTKEWNGSFSNDWDIAENWTPNEVPGLGDAVGVFSSTNDPVIYNENAVANSISVNSGALCVDGGSLTIR
ncbi:MAG: hypothetical protein GY869_01815 [Planctomycetes bacterium]|nr:hypothetical protein [Planctomycetota bacterium]